MVMSTSPRISWTKSKECARHCAYSQQAQRTGLMPLFWTSEKDTPYKANKILCHQLSIFTVAISNYTIRDLERLKGQHKFDLLGRTCDHKSSGWEPLL